MRNRLLPLAVLAIALGLATAAYADISVTTVIVDPQGATGTYDVRTSLWGDLGIGTPPTSSGLYDFTIGVNASGGAAITAAANVSPQAASVGFCQPGVANNGTISGGNVQGVLSWQNALSGPLGVLNNIGIAAGTSNGLSWDADTKLVTGTYSGTGTLAPSVAGRIAFSTLSAPGTITTIGPASWVSGVVTQTIQGGNGNQGGAGAFTNPTVMTVQAGEIHLGAAVAVNSSSMAQNLTLNINSGAGMAGYQEDASVVLDADQSVKAVNIGYGQAGMVNGLDLNGKALKVYSSNLDAAEASLIAAMQEAQTVPGDGIYDSTLIADQARSLRTDWTIGMGRGSDADGNFLMARAVKMGDFDCDGKVGVSDLGQIIQFWNPNGSTGNSHYWQGNADYDNTIGVADLGWIIQNWSPNGYSGFPTGTLGANPVPEPCTMILLSLGALGLIRRKRS
jgi:hypothetical protein